jgi:Uma2 family endonuclease
VIDVRAILFGAAARFGLTFRQAQSDEPKRAKKQREVRPRMLAIRNAIIDDTVKPAIEWINGRPVQKLMPTDLHGILQLAFATFLKIWARSDSAAGKVIPEWRFITPPNAYKTESVVPDVAYLATYFNLRKPDRTYPTIPPDIVVEILSPDDRKEDVAVRPSFFLWWGVKLVLIADPVNRTVEAHEPSQTARFFGEADIVTSSSFPTLAIPLREIFAELDEPSTSSG